jgi:hypothetical protein
VATTFVAIWVFPGRRLAPNHRSMRAGFSALLAGLLLLLAAAVELDFYEVK